MYAPTCSSGVGQQQQQQHCRHRRQHAPTAPHCNCSTIWFVSLCFSTYIYLPNNCTYVWPASGRHTGQLGCHLSAHNYDMDTIQRTTRWRLNTAVCTGSRRVTAKPNNKLSYRNTGSSQVARAVQLYERSHLKRFAIGEWHWKSVKRR